MLSPYEVRIVKYLNELASHGIRSYATGCLIEDCDITLWYIDRMGIVTSASFNFITEPHYLVYFIASVTLASMKQLGFLSLMKFPDRHTPRAILETYDDVSFSLPQARDVDGNPQEGLQFDLSVEEGRYIFNSHKAVGRSTIIVPLKANPAAVQVCQDVKEQLVGKISWQSISTVGEDSAIRIVRRKLAASSSMKHFLDNIVDMKCSATYNMAEMGLPRVAFGLNDPTDERVCRVLVLREYLPLQKVGSPTEFRTVFIDVVQGPCFVSSCSLVADPS